MDIERMKFFGAIELTAEELLGARFGGTEREAFYGRLYAEYQASGAGVPSRKWIRQKLRSEVKFADEPPEWIETLGMSEWPIHDGKPMVFLGQLEVPDKAVTRTHAAAGSVIYLFGARETNGDGWSMVYPPRRTGRWPVKTPNGDWNRHAEIADRRQGHHVPALGERPGVSGTCSARRFGALARRAYAPTLA